MMFIIFYKHLLGRKKFNEFQDRLMEKQFNIVSCSQCDQKF